jgi:hypothetical protein
MSRGFLIAGLLLVFTGAGLAEDKHEHHAPQTASNPHMAKLTKLVGTWVAADEKGQPTDQVVSIIKLTAGGSAIHETLFPGQEHEMVSIYTVDGQDLVMTHYCMLGNQPRMKADPKSAANQIRFVFTGGSNLDPKKDQHMHGATLTIVDNDHIEVVGEGWKDGKPMDEMCGQLKLVRKK